MCTSVGADRCVRPETARERGIIGAHTPVRPYERVLPPHGRLFHARPAIYGDGRM